MPSPDEINALVQRIAGEFHPQKVILFGSRASGESRPDSDVDLLVILPFTGKPFRMSLEILNRTAPTFAVDLLARSPEDTARRFAQGDPLIREALTHGKILYQAAA